MVIDQVKDADIKKRIAAVIEESGKNKSQFAREMGVTPNYLATVLTNPSKGLSATMLKALANMGVNVNWVITGKGDELIENGESWKIEAERAKKEIVALKRDMDSAHALAKSLQEQVKDQIIINYELTRKEQDEKNQKISVN